jgi:integrase/recombinase XerD
LSKTEIEPTATNHIATGGARPEKEDTTDHPSLIWTVTENANLELRRIIDAYLMYLAGRQSKPVSPETLRKYRNSLKSFILSLQRRSVPLILASVTPDEVNAWIAEQRERGLAEEGIASRLSPLKAMTHAFVYHERELTRYDLLGKVPRINTDDLPAPDPLDPSDLEALIAARSGSRFEQVRDRAFLLTLMATGLRIGGAVNMLVSKFDKLTGGFETSTKGGKVQKVCLSPRALKAVQAYLMLRPRDGSDAFWLTSNGSPWKRWSAQRAMYRLKAKSGVQRFHPHLLRHTFGQVALEKGAERAAVQDMLGHETDAMTRRYTRKARERTAAAMMPKYSPV